MQNFNRSMFMCIKRLFLLVLLLLKFFNSIEARDFKSEIQKKYDEYNSSIIGNVDSIITLAHLAIQEYKPYNDSVSIERFYNLLGNCYFDLSEFDSASFYYHLALEERERHNQSPIRLWSNLAYFYYQVDAFDHSRHYANKILSLNEDTLLSKFSFYPYRTAAFSILGLINKDLRKMDSSVYFFRQSIIEFSKISNYLKGDIDSMHLIHIWINIASMYEESSNYDSSAYYYYKVLENTSRSKMKNEMFYFATLVAKQYVMSDGLDSAKKYIDIAKNAFKNWSTLEDRRILARVEMNYVFKTKAFDSVEYFVKRYLSVLDTVHNQKLSRSIHEVETKYQVKEKNAALKLSNEKRERLKAENRTVLSIGIILFVLSMIIIFNYRQRSRIASMKVEMKEKKIGELMASQESKALSAMLKGQEKERERVAQDLHDRLGGTLAALKLALKQPSNSVSQEDLKILDEAVVEVRSISHNLSTGLLDKYGLNEAIRQLFKSVGKSGGLKFSLYLHPDISVLGQSVGIELYRIVQELLTNTIKHAKASEISLQTNFDGKIFNMIFEDNGVGFNAKKMKGGIGMENIKKRVKKIDGTFHIDSSPGRGSIFIIEIKKSA